MRPNLGVGGRTGLGVLVGRDAELAELVAAGRDAMAGRGSLVFVGGEAGIGKTCLVTAAAERWAADGLLVVRAACLADTAPAFWPWVTALRTVFAGEHPTALANLLDSTGRPDAVRDVELDRYLLFASVIDAVREKATEQPLAIVFEDIHWADLSTLKLLRFLLAALAAMRVLVVATYRDTESDPRELLDGARPERDFHLRGLPTAQLVDAVQALTGETLDDTVASAVHARTGGNPFFAAEVTRLLRAEGRLEAPAIPTALPESVRVVLSRRLARVSTTAHDVLQAAAIVGDEFDTALVAATAGVDAAVAVEAIDTAVGVRLVVEVAPDRLAFAHALIGETLRADASRSTRRTLHERAAAAWSARGGDEAIAATARHALAAAAAGGPNEPAVTAASRAAEAAMERTAYEEAHDYLCRVVALLDGSSAWVTRFDLEMRLGEAALAGGDPDAARAAYRRATQLARAASDGPSFARAALGYAGGPIGFEVPWLDPEQVDLLRAALDVLDGGDSAERAAVLARLSIALTHDASTTQRREYADEAVAMARRVGEPRVLATALAAQCDANAGPDEVHQRRAAATEIVEIAVAARDRQLELLGRRLRFVACCELGEWSDVDAEIDAYARVAERVRQPRFGFFVPLWRGMRAFMRGDLDATAALTAEAKSMAEAAQSDNGVVLAASQEFDRLLILGERRAAWDTINAALARMGPHGVLASDVDSLLAMCAEPAEVTAVLDRAVASGFARPLDSEWLIAMAYFADAAVRTRHETAAALLHEKLAPYAGLFVIDGIGAACWSSVDALLASLAPIADREDAGPPEATRVEPLDAEFRREGDIWSLCYADRRVQTTDTKGMRDLATLLSLPGRPVHVSDLVADAVDRGSGGEKSDRRAIGAYRDRLAELERALDDADARNDAARSERLAAERDALVAELASVAGLGDRPRRVDDPVERMRKTVRYRVKAAIDRIERVHPELGRHLAVSVHTGTVCSYDPERPVHWRF